MYVTTVRVYITRPTVYITLYIVNYVYITHYVYITLYVCITLALRQPAAACGSEPWS